MPCCQGILPQVRRRAYNFIYPEAVILLLLKLMVFPVAVHHVRIEGEFVRSHGLFSPILPFFSTLGHDIPLIYLPPHFYHGFPTQNCCSSSQAPTQSC